MKTIICLVISINVNIFTYYFSYNKSSVRDLEDQANELARNEFKYLKSWDLYPHFTKVIFYFLHFYT